MFSNGIFALAGARQENFRADADQPGRDFERRGLAAPLTINVFLRII
jgi:hypothetical protein